MFIEVCVGFLDKNNLEDCICKEMEEEMGYWVLKVRKFFEVYMLFGFVIEVFYFFVVEYDEVMKVGIGGGLVEE